MVYTQFCWVSYKIQLKCVFPVVVTLDNPHNRTQLSNPVVAGWPTDHSFATNAVITLTQTQMHTYPHSQSFFLMVCQAWLWASKLCSEWLTGHWLPDSVCMCTCVGLYVCGLELSVHLTNTRLEYLTDPTIHYGRFSYWIKWSEHWLWC